MEFFQTLEKLIPVEPGKDPSQNETTDEAACSRDVALAQVDGDADLLAEVVDLFLEDHPRLISQIHQAAARGDSYVVQRAAHTLKGSLAIFAARSAVEAALKLEIIGREGNLLDVEKACASLEHEIRRILPALANL
jgi:two-component system sensor histidine kinase/response regulator